jgi:hypothetical protein
MNTFNGGTFPIVEPFPVRGRIADFEASGRQCQYDQAFMQMNAIPHVASG